jgi:Holliday junction resolvasome RuvABC DNA-binding subunit
MTSELCAASGIGKPMVMAVVSNLDTEKFAQWGAENAHHLT